jgi:aminodeoxyfutalosine synthase
MDLFKSIENKIEKGESLSREDGLALLRSNDILSIGKLAHAEKKKKSQNRVFFNVNFHLNLTNVCVSRCKFCAFSCDKGADGEYVLTPDDVINRLRSVAETGITEVHMVSGLHPDLPFTYYVDIVEKLKKEFTSVHIKAFTPVEIKYFSDISGLSIEDVLIRLKEAGLGSLPGGGAEVLCERVRRELCPKKASSLDWLEVMRTAHRIGLKTNATLLYGHIETNDEIIDHLISLQALQAETGGFQAFIPLPFHPENTMMNYFSRTTAFEQIKMISISRLMLNNFDHIKAYWIMSGQKTAQLSLFFGADDIDGTVVEEKIAHTAGAETARGVDKNRLINLIRQTGNIPVQRDTLYNVLEAY